MQIIDLPSDRGFVHFSRIMKSLPDVPSFVKEASQDTCTTVENLPANAYADEHNKKFPCHTKASAWLSYLYFRSQQEKFSKHASARIMSKFASLADVWGIRTELAKADADLSEKPEKQASANDYALNVGGSNFFPINNATALIKSADSLIENRKNFTYAMRKEAATNIMRAAVSQGFNTVDLPAALHRMGGFGLTTKTAVAKELHRRIRYLNVKQAELKEPLTKLASQVCAIDELVPETLTKIAEIVDVIDRQLKISEQYGESFQFPEDVFFSFTEKSAAALKSQNVSMITGTTYSMDQLSKSADALKVFGNDFFSDVTRKDGSVDLQKVADVLPTMPRDEASLFDRAMRSVEKSANGTWDNMKQFWGKDVPSAVDNASQRAFGVQPFSGMRRATAAPVKRPALTINTQLAAPTTPKAPVAAQAPTVPAATKTPAVPTATQSAAAPKPVSA